MTTQLNIFESNKAKREGIKRAEDAANARVMNWSEIAFAWLLRYLSSLEKGDTFRLEQVRETAEAHGFDSPKSKRAWAAIIVRAKREKLVKHFGYTQVHNVNAHRANASLWQKM